MYYVNIFITPSFSFFSEEFKKIMSATEQKQKEPDKKEDQEEQHIEKLEKHIEEYKKEKEKGEKHKLRLNEEKRLLSQKIRELEEEYRTIDRIIDNTETEEFLNKNSLFIDLRNAIISGKIKNPLTLSIFPDCFLCGKKCGIPVNVLCGNSECNIDKSSMSFCLSCIEIYHKISPLSNKCMLCKYDNTSYPSYLIDREKKNDLDTLLEKTESNLITCRMCNNFCTKTLQESLHHYQTSCPKAIIRCNIHSSETFERGSDGCPVCNRTLL